MTKSQFKIMSEVWKWPGDMGWHFVTLPKKISAEIKKTGKTYGSGFIKVEVVLGKTTWVTALFPHKASESYILSIKKKVREKEGIWVGDNVELKLKLI
ncbi:MAG: DUF1905 domain-containing protein [Minisyncoccota bacterium]